MEQHDAVLEFAEDEFFEAKCEVGDQTILFGQRNVDRANETSKTARDGGSAIDGGLRRRIVSVRIESTSEESIREKDIVKSRHLGSVSRQILAPEMPSRDQPPKLRRRKKTRRSLMNARMKKIDQNRRNLAKLERKFYKPWKTGDEFRVPQVDAYPIFVLRDFVMYFIFLTVACLIAFGSRSVAYNYYPEGLTKLIISSHFNSTTGEKITFKEIQFTPDIWKFLEDVLCKVLYGNAFIGADNTLFGAPQLRQLRVRSGTCSSAPMFQSLYVNCADYYSEANEDKDEFGPKTSSWRYFRPHGDQSYFEGAVSTYPGGGFSMNFTRDENFTMYEIAELRDNIWIRFGTRAVLFDFALFNHNTHLFCICKLILELPPFGGIIPNYIFTTFEFLNYEKPWDFFILSCEVIFVCYTLYYSFEEMLQIYRLRSFYLYNWWNFLDVMILLCAYLAIVFSLIVKVRMEGFVRRHVSDIHTPNHVSFDEMVGIQSQYEGIVAILIFNMWLKIFKFTTATRTVSLILAAILRAGWAMIFVTIMLFSILFGYALSGFVMVGSLFQSFSSLGSSIFTVIRLLTGGFHINVHDETHGAKRNGVLWPAVIVFFIVRLTFVNLYVALIVCGFEDEENECNRLSDTASLGDVLRESFCKFLLVIGRDQTALQIDDWEVAKQNIRIHDALVNILRRHGYDGVEIDLIMAKHKITYGFQIRERTMTALYEEIHVRNKLALEVKDHVRMEEQIEQIEEIIELIDLTLMDLIIKADLLTNRFIMRHSK